MTKGNSAARVQRRGNSYILADPAVERFLDKVDLDDPQDLERFNQELDKIGVNKLLKASGVKNGDTIITGKLEWEWHDDEHRPDGRNF